MNDYFGSLEEESIRDNFVLVYELLDEMMDHGYPQIAEVKVLKEYITQGAHKLALAKPPQAVTNVVSWRTEGIRHKKNEVFLDVIEKLNILVSGSGAVLFSEILGAIKMRSFLSGSAWRRMRLLRAAQQTSLTLRPADPAIPPSHTFSARAQARPERQGAL